MYNFCYPGKQKHAPKTSPTSPSRKTIHSTTKYLALQIWFIIFLLLSEYFTPLVCPFHLTRKSRTPKLGVKKGYKRTVIFPIKHSNSSHVTEGIESVCHVQPATHSFYSHFNWNCNFHIFTSVFSSSIFALLNRRLIVELQFVTWQLHALHFVWILFDVLLAQDNKYFLYPPFSCGSDTMIVKFQHVLLCPDTKISLNQSKLNWIWSLHWSM